MKLGLKALLRVNRPPSIKLRGEGGEGGGEGEGGKGGCTLRGEPRKCDFINSCQEFDVWPPPASLANKTATLFGRRASYGSNAGVTWE